MSSLARGGTAGRHARPAQFLCVLAALWSWAAAAPAPAAPVSVALTADTEGHVGPCQDCPAHAGAGGLARRATVLAELRRQDPTLLTLDAGNALFGAESIASGGRVIVAAYDQLGYQAVNVSYRDFRAGKAATLEALRPAKFAAVSANLLDADSGQPLFKPYAVVKAGAGPRVAVIGVTEAPAGYGILPHLKKQLAGVRIAPPAEAVAAALPKARAEADEVVLLYYGSPAGAAALRDRFGKEVAAVLVGGARPEQLPAAAGAAPPLVACAEHGKGLAAVTLGGAGAGPREPARQVPVEPTVAADPRTEEALARFNKPPAPLPPAPAAAPAPDAADAPVAAAPQAAPAPGAPAALPDTLEPGKAYEVNASGANRGARLTVATASVADSYGPVAARPGRRLLLLDTEWENVIPLTPGRDNKQQIATTYSIPALGDHVYLLVNGSRVARVLPRDNSVTGHVPVVDFKLEKLGSRLRGNLLFDVPDGALGSLELRVYDYAHGHMALPIRPAPGGAAEAKPLSAPLKNEVVELAAFGVTRSPELAGRKAPEGMTFVTVDLRARSLFTVDADAAAFDPKARPGAKTKVGHVADWKESRRYLQLVADGEYGYMAEAGGTELEEEPRFLPDVMTGGNVAFLAPEKATSLELRCDFPNAKASTGGAVFRPRGLTLALEGKRPPLPQPQAIARVDDDVYRISVVDQTAADAFAGQKPAAGGRFLVLDVTVANTGGRNGEFFQTKEQLKYAAASGQQSEMSPVTFAGPRRPAELVWIPPGERRTFQVVFEIAADETKPRLAFRGVSKAEVLNLKPLERGAVAVAPKSAPAPGGAPAAPAPAAPQAAKPPAKEPMKVAANTNPPAAPGASAPSVPSVAPKAPPFKEPTEAKPLRVTAKQPHPAKGLAGVGLTAEQVNAAIDRGAEGLWALKTAEMKKNRTELGAKLGYDVLIGLALVHADFHKKSPEFDAALRKMLAGANPADLGTYGAGCYIMLIEAYGDGYFLPKLRQTVRCLLETQGIEGSWGYYAKAPEETLRDPLAERVLQIRGGLPLEGEGALGTPMKRITPFKKDDDGDNSTSQYAMLGLWSATKAKVPVEPEAWKRALAVYRARQTPDGAWNYTTSTSYGYGSMACAGVCAITLARHHLGEADPARDEAVERGLAWLANHFIVTKHPEGSDQHLYYYLYSLERVGRILDTEFIGPHEWYPLGARWLVDNQKADGTWGGGNNEDEPVATPFALMFLTRATTTLNPEQKRGGDGKLRTDVAVAPGHRIYIILDCSGSMLPEMDGVQKFQAAREAVAGLVKELPDNAEVALRVYGHRKNARQEGADQDTELLLPMQPLNRQAFAAKLNALRPRGKTPLALSLREAAKDLAGVARDKAKPVTLVLLTDGGEDTRPRQDPLAAAEEVGKLEGVNFQIVGFDINRADWDEQLQGMAARGGGTYLPASEAASLLRDLRSAVFRVPDTFVVATAKGQPVFKAQFGTTRTLPEGKYRFETVFGGKRYAQDFWVNTDSTTAVVFDAANTAKDKSGQAVAGGEGARPARRPPAAVADDAEADAPSEDAAPPARPQRPVPAPARPPAGAPAKKKFCTECGKAVAPGAKFCPSCGAKVTN